MKNSHSRKVHELKTLSENFLNIDSGVQIRKNDRDFQENDIVLLFEIDSQGVPSGKCQAGVIDHLLHNCEGLEEGYVVFKVEPMSLIIHEGKRYVTKE